MTTASTETVNAAPVRSGAWLEPVGLERRVASGETPARSGVGGVRKQTPNVFGESASAMAAILDLHFPTGTILDVNFGLGAFYRKTDRKVTGVDIRPPAEIICSNRNLPFADDSFDVGVCDPPYKRGDGKKYEHRYGVAPKTETQVTWSYYETLAELLRVVRVGVIIKVQDGTDGHRFHARHLQVAAWMKERTGLEPHDIAVNSRKTLAPTMAQGVPHFFQQGVSYFLIYRWREKWKPLRFSSVRRAAGAGRGAEKRVNGTAEKGSNR